MLKCRAGVVVASFLMLAQSLAAVAPAAAQKAAGKANGRELAGRLCVNCHFLDHGTNTGSGGIAPSFAQIAGKQGQTSERVAGAIIIPHPEMPTVSLTMQEIRDVVAYIMSLKP